jgi:hypothetical protein
LRVTLGLGGFAIGLGALYYAKKSNEEDQKANEEAYRKSFEYSEKHVRRPFIVQSLSLSTNFLDWKEASFI